jgi:5-(carboxyamino)imidazole ribonucleotide mutase
VAKRKTDQRRPLVGILMGSDSDLPVMFESAKVLEKFGIAYEMQVISAHRSPARTHEYATSAVRRGLKAIIVGAGGAAHLAGVVASLTTLPVIGVPISSATLRGMDSLLATVQMPSGIPVATMAIDKAGAANAAILAAQILGISDQRVARGLVTHKRALAHSVAEKNVRLQQRLADGKK